MKATLLLSLILSGIQANYINNNTNSTNSTNSINSINSTISTSALGNVTRVYNISTTRTNLPVTRIPTLAKTRIFSTTVSKEKKNQLQVCFLKEITGSDLNTSKTLQNYSNSQIAYNISWRPIINMCKISVLNVDYNEKFKQSYFFNNINKTNCDSSFPKTNCADTNLCKRDIACCNDTKLETVTGCNQVIVINRCKAIRNTSECAIITQINIPIKTIYPSTSPSTRYPTLNSAETTASKILTPIIAFIVVNILR